MKKALLCFIATILITSCKKDYVCKCTTMMNVPQPVVTYHTIHATKQNAEFECSTIPTADGGCKIE
ncbi:MAG TPA: hypothetical protein VN698_07380 [Bacteroidia bacterium]|nr:hypothetical protein [Bacteroidia bacterium]